jgi:hypothetical protein
MGIPLRNAAKVIGVAYQTLRMYEVDSTAVSTIEKRRACALFYDELRRLMDRSPLTRETVEDAAE